MFYIVLFPILSVVLFSLRGLAIGDLGIWIAQGLKNVEASTVLKHDVFSFLKTTEFVYPSAGVSFAYAFIFKITGLNGVFLFHYVVAALISFFQIKGSTNYKNFEKQPLWLLVLCLSLFGFSPLWIARPALLGALYLVLIYPLVQRPKWNFSVFAMIQILWVNTHGSFVLLPLICIWKAFFECALEKKWVLMIRRIIMGLCLALIAGLMNPFGFKVYEYLIETSKFSAIRGLAEWGPSTFWAEPPFGLLFYFVAGSVFLGFVFRKIPKTLVSSPYVFMLILGCTAIRHAVLSFALLPLFAAEISFLNRFDKTKDNPIEQGGALLRKRINVGIIGFLFLIAATLSPWLKESTQKTLNLPIQLYDENWVGDSILEALLKDPSQKKILHDWGAGSHLALSQHNKTFLDTRNIIFSETDVQNHKKMFQGDALSLEVLNNYNVDYLLVPRFLKDFLIQIERSNHWKILAEDEIRILYTKRPQS